MSIQYSTHDNRFVLSKVEDLEAHLHSMSNRIRRLEDALQVEHSQRTSNIHPLLDNGLLAVGNINSVLRSDTGGERSSTDDHTGIDVGTFAVSANCSVCFYEAISSEVSCD